MAIAVDKLEVGKSFIQGVSQSSVAFTTTQAVAAGGFIVVLVTWYGATGNLSGVSGGGLTWNIDKQGKPDPPGTTQMAVVSAQAPSGLASGTTITATFSDSTADYPSIGAISFTGVATSNPVDGTIPEPTGAAGSTAWATASYAMTAGSVLVGHSWDDNGTTSTPSQGSEAWENPGDGFCQVAHYRIEAGAGSYTLAGTWTGSGNISSLAVAYLAESGEAPMQALAPSADSVDGTWTDNGGGTNLAAQIDEAAASDTDYIQSSANPQTQGCRVKLAGGTDPSSGIGHQIKWRIRKDAGSTATINMTVRLYQGGGNSLGAGTLIKEAPRTNVDGAGWNTYTELLSKAEADSISDYSDLYLEFWADVP